MRNVRLSPVKTWTATLFSALGLLVAGQASATGYPPPPTGPDAEGCSTIVESDFGAYTVEKCYEVWEDDNPGNPAPVPGSFTYVYTLESDPSSFTNIIQFEIETPPSLAAVTGASFGAGSGGVEPDSINTALAGKVVFTFIDPGPVGGPCEGIQGICPGSTSAPLIVSSPFGPGSVSDNIIVLLDDFSLDEVATCVGPSTLPNPVPCATLFWQLRALLHFFVKHHFPDTKWDQLTQYAADISTVFATPQEVVSALFAGWFATNLQKAKFQLAAVLLNIAAGELFPGNTKCRLFFDTPVDTDCDDVGDTTVGEILVEIESNILSGNATLINEAKIMALQLNLGVGLIDTTMFY